MEATTTALVQYVPQETLPILSGCFAFGSTLAVSTMAQKLVGISTATRILPSMFGIATVCIASLCSQHASVTSHIWLQYNQEFYRKQVSILQRYKSSSFYKNVISSSNNNNSNPRRINKPYNNN